MRILSSLPLLASLVACRDGTKLDPVVIESSSTASCSTEKTFLDQLDAPGRLQEWIDEALLEEREPIMSVVIPIDDLDGSEKLKKKIPDGVDGIGVMSYLGSSSEGIDYGVVRYEGGGFKFALPAEHVTCDDLSFAYRIYEFLLIDITVAGKCEFSNDELTCQGSFYDACPTDSENPLGPYDDCEVLANFTVVEEDRRTYDPSAYE